MSYEMRLSESIYELPKRKFMLLDILGIMYNLCDPEITTFELFDGECEIYICSENLSDLAFSKLVKEQYLVDIVECL